MIKGARPEILDGSVKRILIWKKRNEDMAVLNDGLQIRLLAEDLRGMQTLYT